MSRGWQISEICRWLGVAAPGATFLVKGFSIDTRTIAPGEIFFAIKGDSLDGHDYIDQAVEQGAVAVVTQKWVSTTVPVIQVTDTTKALGQVATAIRQLYSPKTVAVTGSCGKTTTKAMLANILRIAGPTLVPEKNYNNQWGLPLTLFNLNETHKFAVLELGADHVGEIATLTAIAKPDVAILTCAQPVHVEKFGSLENIVKGKGEIFQGLPDEEGAAIINADDVHADYWRGLIKPTQRIITFGIHNAADVSAQDIHMDELSQPSFTLIYKSQRIPIKLNVMGEHNIANALGAAAACFALGISTETIQRGLGEMSPVAGRLVRKMGLNGALLIDDTYNSNPHALKAALAVLAANPKDKILVLGDMLELGEQAEKLHYEAGTLAREAGVKKLYAYGPLSVEAVKAFGTGASHYETHEALTEALKKELSNETAVLFKASRGMKLEKIVQAVAV